MGGVSLSGSSLEHFACKSGCTACCKGVVSLAIPELENMVQARGGGDTDGQNPLQGRAKMVDPENPRDGQNPLRGRARMVDPKCAKDGALMEGVPARDGQYPKCAKDGALMEGVRKGCPFRTSEGCSVYSDRPFMCRLFGFQYLHPEMRTQPYCTRIPLMRPGDREADLLKEYMKWCEQVGFVIIGEPLDCRSENVLIEENRRATERCPSLIQFKDLLTGKGRCFQNSGSR